MAGRTSLPSSSVRVAHPLVLESEADIEAVVRAMRTVAVVGMKDGAEPSQPAFTVPRSLQARGVRVVPVNPKIAGAVVLGEPAYATLASVPSPFDLVCVFRRPEHVPAVADDVLALPPERRPAVVWMQSGIEHEEAAEKLAAAGIRVVMDRCLAVEAARFRPRV